MPRPPRRVELQSASILFGVDHEHSPAGMEPAAPSLPWIGGQAPCYPASPQLAQDRKRRSYGAGFGASKAHCSDGTRAAPQPRLRPWTQGQV
jgi:hypothetical protein